jgi:hypothetical protein
MKTYVLCVRRYSFTPEGKAEVLRGVTVTGVTDSVESTSDFKGKQPMKFSSSDTSIWNSFSSVPAWYDLEISMAANSRGETKIKLCGAKLLQEQKS